MPKLKEQGRVRAHRWRDSIFVQLVLRYPRSARLFLLFLLLSISYRIWEIGTYLLAQQARVQVIESVRLDEPNQFKEAQQIRKKLDQIIQQTQAFPCAEEVAMKAHWRINTANGSELLSRRCLCLLIWLSEIS